MNLRNVNILIFLLVYLASSNAQDTQTTIMDFEKESFLRLQSYQSRKVTSNQVQFDVQFYEIDLGLFPDAKYLRGSVLIQGRSLVNALDHIEIDLYSNMMVDSVIEDGSFLSYQRVSDQVDISFPQPLQHNEQFAVEVYYQGNPQATGLGAFNWRSYQGIPRIWTLSEPYGAPAWWPCKDDPEDKADSVFINVSVPQNLVALSNGILKDVTPKGDSQKTYHWETRYPITTYLVFIAVADYAQFDDWYVNANGDSMPLNYYVYPEFLNAAQSDFSVTADMLEAFAPLFGEYPFINEKYGMASVAGGASMEHQTMTTLNQTHITGAQLSDGVISHELAHQWFGDAITMKSWQHIWLNEGFATYSEALWSEHVRGKQAYRRKMGDKDHGYFTGTVFVPDTTNISSLFSRTVYFKGAWVLHMLRGVLGDSVFFRAMKNYATDPDLIYGNATSENFQNICEAVSTLDLDWFFEQWLYRPGRPVYKYKWEVEGNSSPYVITLYIEQSNLQNGVNDIPYKMPLEIRISRAGFEQTHIIWDSLKSQQFEFVTAERPNKLEIDPDNWVLKKLISSDFSGIPTTLKLSQNYPNPFNGSTTIAYGNPIPGEVRIEIYNVLGKRVYERRITQQLIAFHEFTWNGTDSRGHELPSGIYFYRFSQGQNSVVRKMILAR